MTQRIRGFTLVELMIVVVVLAILAAIAIPSYRGYMMRAQRTDATTVLLRIRVAQEKFFLQNNRYSNNLGPTPATGLRLTGTDGTTMVTENGHYTVTLNRPDDLTYIVTAVATGGQTQDTNCTTFTINEQGTRTTSPDTNVANCWK